MDDYKAERYAWVERYIAARVEDARILQAFKTVPRHEFVGPGDKAKAYKDRPLPIGHGQTISQPSLVAQMVALLKLTGKETVLDVGAGSGFQAAILGQLAKKVIGIEIVSELAEEAQGRMERLGYENVTITQGNGWYGHEPEAPYDGIKVAAAADSIPTALIEQLEEGGRLVIPVERPMGMQRVIVGIKRDGELDTFEHDVVRFVPFVKNSH